MATILTSLLALLAVELCLRMPFVTHAQLLLLLVRKSIRVFISPYNFDIRKQVVLLRYAHDLVVQATLLAFMLICIALMLILPALLLDWLIVPPLLILKSMGNLDNLTIISAVSACYIYVRKRLATIKL